MTESNEDALAAAVQCLNECFQLYGVSEIDEKGAIGQAIRLHLAGKRATALLRETFAVRRRIEKQLLKWPREGIATTQSGDHIQLLGFNADGFAIVRRLRANYDKLSDNPNDPLEIVLGVETFPLPVQTSLQRCSIFASHHYDDGDVDAFLTNAEQNRLNAAAKAGVEPHKRSEG